MSRVHERAFYATVELYGEDIVKFEELKAVKGSLKHNTDILRECIRDTHKLLLG